MSDKLRFKDNNGQEYPKWKSSSLYEISKLYQPQTIQESSFSTTGFPVYGANGIIGLYPKYNHETRQIAMACRGNSCGAINFTKQFSWITGNAMVINTDGYEDIIVKTFLMYQLGYSNLKYLITGGGQPQITRENLKTHIVKVPIIQEQQKIADFLSTVDDKIENQKEIVANWEEIKKGLIQKIFSQEIRFKDENGQDYLEWKSNKVINLVQLLSIKNHQIQTNQYLLNGKYKVVDQGESTFAAYSDMEDKLFTNTPIIVYGDHTTFIKYVKESFIVGGDGVKLLKVINDNIPQYMYYAMLANNITPEGYKRHWSIFKNKVIPIPTKKEQQKIGDFLSIVDKKIEQEKNILNELTELKKGLLQRIFT